MYFSQFARLGVVQLRLRRSNREKPNMAQHLVPLASNIVEKRGLVNRDFSQQVDIGQHHAGSPHNSR